MKKAYKKVEDREQSKAMEVIRRFALYELKRYEETLSPDHPHAIGENIAGIRKAFETAFMLNIERGRKEGIWRFFD